MVSSKNISFLHIITMSRAYPFAIVMCGHHALDHILSFHVLDCQHPAPELTADVAVGGEVPPDWKGDQAWPSG